MIIDKTAVIGKKVEIDKDVDIGPYAVIEDDVRIGKNVKILSHAYIARGTEIGDKTEIHMGAVIGHVPQDVNYKDEESYTKIGKGNIIREYVTIHRGSGKDSATIIGDGNYFMALSHVGHNCVIGNKNILANGALLAGHVFVGNGVFISGNVSVHQFCRIGDLAFIGGFSGVNKDVPPYMVVRGASIVRYINVIGLKRAGFNADVINQIRDAFKTIYRSNLNITQAVRQILSNNPIKEVAHLAEFIKNSKRGICKHASLRDMEDYAV